MLALSLGVIKNGKRETNILKVKNTLLPSITGCLFVQLCVGILYLWSMFRGPVVAHYNWSNEAATMVFSYMMVAFVAGNLIGGFFQDKTNPKLVATIGCVIFCGGIFLTSLLTERNIKLIYLTYSGMSGIGCGFVYGSVLSCLQKWMPHRRGFASGLSVSAFGLSTVVFGPLSSWLLSLPAFEGNAVPMTFRTLSIVFFIVSMAACVLIRLPSQAYLNSLNLPASVSNTASKTPGQAIRYLPFCCVVLSCFLISGIWNIVSPAIKDLGAARGLSESLAVAAVSLSGIANTAGRLSMASLSDKIGRGKTVQILGLLTLSASLGMIYFGGLIMVLLVLALAFAYGGASATFPAIIADLCGTKYLGTNFGISLLSLGFSSILFNAVSNAMIMATGSDTLSFLFGGAAGVLPVLLMLPVNNAYKKLAQAAKGAVAE